jgi:hypothetical protein
MGDYEKKSRPAATAQMERDPHARAYRVRLDVEVPGYRGLRPRLAVVQFERAFPGISRD